jgi:hypothetical protein
VLVGLIWWKLLPRCSRRTRRKKLELEVTTIVPNLTKPSLPCSLTGWIYVKTVYDFTGWLAQSAAGVHHHQSPFVWMFKRVVGEAMPRGFYKDCVTQPGYFGAEGRPDGEGVKFMTSMPVGHPAIAPRLREEELDAVTSGVRSIAHLCTKEERAEHRWMCRNLDIPVVVDEDLKPGEIGQRGVLKIGGKSIEIRVLDILPEDMWASSRVYSHDMEQKDEDLVVPHSVVSNVSASRGISTRGKDGRAMLGRGHQLHTKHLAKKRRRAKKRAAFSRPDDSCDYDSAAFTSSSDNSVASLSDGDPAGRSSDSVEPSQEFSTTESDSGALVPARCVLREYWGPRSTKGLGPQYKNSQRIFVVELEDETRIEVLAEDLVDGKKDDMYAEENPHYQPAIAVWREEHDQVPRPVRQVPKATLRRSRRQKKR